MIAEREGDTIYIEASMAEVGRIIFRLSDALRNDLHLNSKYFIKYITIIDAIDEEFLTSSAVILDALMPTLGLAK